MSNNKDNYAPSGGRMFNSTGDIVWEGDGINEDGSQNVRDLGVLPVEHTFFEGATDIGDSEFIIGDKQLLTIEIYGDATATVNFWVKHSSGIPRPIFGVCTGNRDPGWSGNNNEIWEFTVGTLKSFIAEIASVTGGSVTIKGHAI